MMVAREILSATSSLHGHTSPPRFVDPSFHCSITESHPRILIMWVYCCEVSCIGKWAGSIFVDVKVRLTVFKCGVEESLSKLR